MLKNPSKKSRAQSAMEYLMTYGWAILIIAVVLGALFSLGVFSGASLTGNACVAASGYYCQNPLYSHATPGNIVTTIGQSTGATWYSANFIFVPQSNSGTSASTGLPYLLTAANIVTFGSGNVPLSSGAQSGISLGVPNTAGTSALGAVSVGTPATGTVWAVYYTTTQAGTPQYAQIATVNLKAT